MSPSPGEAADVDRPVSKGPGAAGTSFQHQPTESQKVTYPSPGSELSRVVAWLLRVGAGGGSRARLWATQASLLCGPGQMSSRASSRALGELTSRLLGQGLPTLWWEIHVDLSHPSLQVFPALYYLEHQGCDPGRPQHHRGEDERHLCERVGSHPPSHPSRLHGVASAPSGVVVGWERGNSGVGKGENKKGRMALWEWSLPLGSQPPPDFFFHVNLCIELTRLEDIPQERSENILKFMTHSVHQVIFPLSLTKFSDLLSSLFAYVEAAYCSGDLS